MAKIDDIEAGAHESAQPGFVGGGIGMYTNPKLKNPKFDTYPKHLPIDNFIQRGYLRLLGENLAAMGTAGLVENSQSEADVRAAANQMGAKLDFQFNPSQLTRSVTARTDTQLWINQSPSMLLQPGIGDMTFGWQMLFNREAEVQNNYIRRRQRSAFSMEKDEGNQLDDFIARHDIDSPEVAARIGVLADIMVLDSITGQRLTEATVNYSHAYAQAIRDGNEPPDENAAVASNLTGSQQATLLQANMTNAAFLIPNPIRAVFSENFMVDGYVNQVTVSLQKFSPEMVPTVAFVDISMHAIYQGFTRKTTVFTALAAAMRDQEVSASVNPAAGEDQRKIAENENDETFKLQDEGYDGSGSLFAGFDHSPMDTGEIDLGSWGPLDFGEINIPGSGDAQTRLNEHRFTGAGLSDAGSEPCQVGGGSTSNALSFAFASSLANSDLGKALSVANNPGKEGHRERDETFARIKERLGGQYWVGMALRARLKADSIADLRKLWSGDQTGFTDYVKTDHFFGEWPADVRAQMFMIGIDNMKYRADGSVVDRYALRDRRSETNGQQSGFYTRSFPITEIPEFDGHFGDEFHRHHGTFDNSHIQYRFGDSKAESSGIVQYGWMWLPDQKGYTIPSTEFNYLLGKGFYTADRPFPDTLTLDGSPDVEFDIEYQWVITYRVRLLMDNNAGGTRPISDTGIIWVYPRDKTTDIIKDIAKDGFLSEINTKQLGGERTGSVGSGIEKAMEDWFWLSGRTQELFYDDLHDTGQRHVNSKLYAKAFNPDIRVENPRLGGMSISPDGVLVGLSQTAGN